MKTIKILGIGSPFGDDQLGWHVIEELKKSQFMINHETNIVLESCDRPGTHLINLLKDIDFAILVDAIKTNQKPGTIYRLINEEIEIYNNIFSTHSMGVGETIKLGKALGELPRKIILYGIEIKSLEMECELSKPIKDGIKKITQLIEKEIKDFIY